MVFIGAFLFGSLLYEVLRLVGRSRETTKKGKV